MWKAIFLVYTAVFAVSSGLMTGGFQDVDPNDEGVRGALNFAVVQHNRVSNDMYLRQVAEVVKVQRQVVSGLKYVITVNMARSLCRKSSPQEVCEIPQSAQIHLLGAVMYSKDLYTCALCPYMGLWKCCCGVAEGPTTVSIKLCFVVLVSCLTSRLNGILIICGPYQCTFTVWTRPWMNEVKLLKEICPPTNDV